MIKFNRRIYRRLISLTTRRFSEIADVDLQGKYGMLMKEPQDGAHQYDPSRIPKLFTEVGSTTKDELDEAIEELQRLDPYSAKNML